MTGLAGRWNVPVIVPATASVCAVELATLSAALRSDLSITSIGILMACFHAGYLMADPLRRRHTFGGGTLAIVTVLAAACLCVIGLTWSVPLLALALFLFNSVAQAYRRSVKDLVPVPSVIKNTGKATGMVFGGAIGAIHYGPIALMIFVLYFATLRQMRSAAPTPVAAQALGRRDRMLLWGEFFHHAHYFAYCYNFWYLAPSLISPWTGLWFVLGWLAYFVTERIWREGRRTFAPKAIAAGHTLVAVGLIAMSHANTVGVLIAWFATGLGGGTAYMLGNSGHHGPRERFEDAGHVTGVLIAALLALFVRTNRDAAELTVIAGACLAVVTAILFMSVSPRGLDRDTQRIGEGNARR